MRCCAPTATYFFLPTNLICMRIRSSSVIWSCDILSISAISNVLSKFSIDSTWALNLMGHCNRLHLRNSRNKLEINYAFSDVTMSKKRIWKIENFYLPIFWLIRPLHHLSAISFLVNNRTKIIANTIKSSLDHG